MVISTGPLIRRSTLTLGAPCWYTGRFLNLGGKSRRKNWAEQQARIEWRAPLAGETEAKRCVSRRAGHSIVLCACVYTCGRRSKKNPRDRASRPVPSRLTDWLTDSASQHVQSPHLHQHTPAGIHFPRSLSFPAPFQLLSEPCLLSYISAEALVRCLHLRGPHSSCVLSSVRHASSPPSEILFASWKRGIRSRIREICILIFVYNCLWFSAFIWFYLNDEFLRENFKTENPICLRSVLNIFHATVSCTICIGYMLKYVIQFKLSKSWFTTPLWFLARQLERTFG